MYQTSNLPEPGPAPEPLPNEQPDVQPEPTERPRRRRIMQPTFERVTLPFEKTRRAFITALLVVGIAAAQAQTTPTPAPTPKPNTPTTPTHPAPEQPDRTHPPVTPQDPAKPKPQATTATPQGWVPFNEQVGTQLELEPNQLQRLRDVDMKYRKDYDALGTNPTAHANYRALSDRRNTDVRAIMTPEQYTRWNNQYNTTTAPPKITATPSTVPK